MPIKMVRTSSGLGLSIFCDHCGERIEDAKNGNLCSRLLKKEGESGETFFTHKQCHDKFEKNRGGAWGTDELRNFPIRLALNLSIEVDSEVEGRTLHYNLRGSLINFE